MPWYTWSKTAASNGTADSTINWAEGQPPGSVNDSSRAEMAAGAKFRDDISGSITTGGTSTAYTVTSNSVFDTLAHLDGQMIAFVPHTTCGSTVTLSVDGLGAKPLRTSPGVELVAGTLIQGTPYVATYNNSDVAFYLHSFFANPFNIPIGGLMPYLGSSAPNSAFVLPFAQAISRTTYATLFSLISTTFGVGDGSTTFNVPDLRGRGIFGLDNMGGSAASRITVAGGNFDGTVLGGTGGAQNHTLTNTEIPLHTHSITDPQHAHFILSTHDATAIVDNGAGGSFDLATGGKSGVNPSQVQPASTGITGTNSAGGGTPPGGGSHTIMPPVMVLPFILRVI